MSKTLSLTAADGHQFSAYLTEPAGTARGGVVVLPEIFGVNSHIRSVADGYAADGYLVIAPALFDRTERGVEIGYSPDEIQRGIALMQAVPIDKALLDIAAAMAHVKPAGRLGMLGFCWGGALTWQAACRLDGIAAAVPYYGGGMPDQKALLAKGPVMVHFGETDGSIPLAGAQAFREAQPQVEVNFYPAGHGFNCDQRASFDAASAALARERTLAFLRQHVG